MLRHPVLTAVARLLVLPALAASLVGGCATNPVTGRPQLSFFGEEAELEMGREGNAEILAQVPLYDDPRLAEYIDALGRKLAATSERPYLPWRFKVLDDPAVNAFALPGGYVYVTRGLLAELESEAEVAAVLGHEIGHVTARHSVHRQSQQILTTIGVGVAAVVLDAEHADEWFELGVLGTGVLFLKYSRDDERQADDLGLRYVLRAGYDPRRMPGVFQMLEQVAAASDDGGMPTWLSTHPDPGKRRLRIADQVSAMQAAGQLDSLGVVGSEAYLAHLDGMAFGPDPSRGALRAGEAVHAGLGFRLQAPDGWEVAGGTQGMTMSDPERKVTIVVSACDETSTFAADDAFFAGGANDRGRTWHGEQGNGDARWSRFSGRRGDTAVEGTVGFVAQSGEVYRLLAMAAPADWAQQREVAEAALASFESLPADFAATAVGDRLQLVPLEQATPLRQFAEEYPSTVPLEVLSLLNRVPPDGTLAAGTQAKRVVPGDMGHPERYEHLFAKSP